MPTYIGYCYRVEAADEYEAAELISKGYGAKIHPDEVLRIDPDTWRVLEKNNNSGDN